MIELSFCYYRLWTQRALQAEKEPCLGPRGKEGDSMFNPTVSMFHTEEGREMKLGEAVQEWIQKSLLCSAKIMDFVLRWIWSHCGVLSRDDIIRTGCRVSWMSTRAEARGQLGCGCSSRQQKVVTEIGLWPWGWRWHHVGLCLTSWSRIMLQKLFWKPYGGWPMLLVLLLMTIIMIICWIKVSFQQISILG